ncbi:MAG: CoA pyrophosphatase [Ilumatobacteraceae bacterium]
MAGVPLRSSQWRSGGDQRIPRPDGWLHGGLGPWVDRVHPLWAADVVAAVADRAHCDRPAPDGTHRESAVLVAIADGPEGAEVLLTRRSQALASHRGEISFPGGRVDAGETFEQTALREAHEEVALDPAALALHGRLDPISTMVTRSFIVPVVGALNGRPSLRPAEHEVERILWVPLGELTRSDTFREEVWNYNDAPRPMFFFELDDETIWGATARILHQLLRVALGIEGPEPLAL